MLPKPVIIPRKRGERLVPEYRHPDRILPCKSREQLLATLAYYAHPFIKLRTPDTTHARRRYVEQVRPALRWFCKKYGVDVPKWLEGNSHYDEIPKEEHIDLFGEGPLEVHEFDEFKSAKVNAPADKKGRLDAGAF